MKREEQIISEAKKHYYDDINCHNAFLHGVEWADEHPIDVWHEAKEIPKENEWVLAYYLCDTFIVGIVDKDEWACLWLNGLKLAKWAYIRDLLP